MTPVDGIYEIMRGSEMSYISVDGRYVIIGDMIDLDMTPTSPRPAAAAFATA